MYIVIKKNLYNFNYFCILVVKIERILLLLLTGDRPFRHTVYYFLSATPKLCDSKMFSQSLTTKNFNYFYLKIDG